MIMLMMSGGVLVLQGQTDLIYNMQDLKTALVCDGGKIEPFSPNIRAGRKQEIPELSDLLSSLFA